MLAAKVVFRGSEEEQRVAEQAFRLFCAKGMLYASNAPIEASLESLADYFLNQGVRPSQAEVIKILEAALHANSDVFGREERDERVIYITTKKGHYEAPVKGSADKHSLPSRLARVPEQAEGVSARSAIAPIWMEPLQKPAAKGKAKPTPKMLLPDGSVIDLARSSEELMARHAQAIHEVLYDYLVQDPRFVEFGGEWFTEEGLAKFTKGDLRRIREHLELEGDVGISDAAIMAEVFNKKTEDPDYHLFRFSLNYRMAHEKREFDFVGAPSQPLWVRAGVSVVPVRKGTPKASEIANDYRYLVDSEETLYETIVTDEHGFPQLIEHTLTFFEVENGILPYDAVARQLFPVPTVEGQKWAQIIFNLPQIQGEVVTELHYPTGTRGGWLVGLVDFFAQYLVPGARMAIEATQEETVFDLTFSRTDERSVGELVYDEKRNRFDFKSRRIDCIVEPSLAITRERFPSLDGLKRLDEVARRKAENVINYFFAAIGTPLPAGEGEVRYRASLDDLFVAVNIEKPFSRHHVETLLESPQYSMYTRDRENPQCFIYTPGKGKKH